MKRGANPPTNRSRGGFKTGRHQGGIALMLVLWILTLLTIIAIGLTTTQRTESALAANQIASAIFRAQADAAIQFAALNLLAQPPPEAGGESLEDLGLWVPDGLPRAWSLGGEALEIRIIDEASLIDLNLADRGLLLALLLAAGAEERDPDSLVDAILDWRDEDDLRLLNGAEDPDYDAAGRPYGAKDGPFDSVEELQQVLGFDRELYRALAPALTVSSGQASPGAEFAPPLVRAAVEGISLEEMRDRLQQEAEVLGDMPGPAGRGGPLYRIQVRWRAPGGAFRAMEALVRVQAGGLPPVAVLARRFAIASEPAGVALVGGLDDGE